MSILRKIRNFFWNYPEIFFFGNRSSIYSIYQFYQNLVPISSAVLLFILFWGSFFSAINNVEVLLETNKKMLIEGVVMPVNLKGKIEPPNKISPLTSDTNKTRLEKDLIELIYEGLIRVNNKGEPEEILASFGELEKGRRYQFKLKNDLKWHDGKPITVADVEATYELLKQLENNPQTSTIYSKAAIKMDLIKSIDDPLAFEFVIKGNNVIPGFFEAISYKILPAHMLDDINPNNIDLADPVINRNPVGSGPYKFYSKADDSIILNVNNEYHGKVPSIQRIKFKFFGDEKSAINALKTGQIHALANVPIDDLLIDRFPKNINIVKTNVFYNQYWGIYLNQADTSSTTPSLKEVSVRKAIALGINKDYLVNNIMGGYAEPAFGPIPPTSFAYTSDYQTSYDVAAAKALLDNAGWVIPAESTIRKKGETELSFKMLYLNTTQRKLIAEQIQKDLAVIGIKLEITSLTPTEMTSNLYSRTFQSILYGTQTFIDPDRYELFHSSQIDGSGLNLSSWKSSELTSVVIDGNKQKIPESDDVLNLARRIVDEEERAKKYKVFLKLVDNESPVIFLYYPIDNYLYNDRISNFTLDDMNTIHERFRKIADWQLKI